jgi:hypothetical protein
MVCIKVEPLFVVVFADEVANLEWRAAINADAFVRVDVRKANVTGPVVYSSRLYAQTIAVALVDDNVR